MIYTSNGKQVLFYNEGAGAPIHIADAMDNKAAHAIAHRMNGGNFIANALRTKSPNFYGGRVSKQRFVAIVNDAIFALNQLDKVKKSLFYGRDNNLDPASGQKSCNAIPSDIAKATKGDVWDGDDYLNAVDIIHGILGKATEAGELLEALKKAYNGDSNGLDMVNLEEEIGDGFWYDAILLNVTGGDFGQVQERIIAKLKARFPDKYADDKANERDLEAERAILEHGIAVDENGYIAGYEVTEDSKDNLVKLKHSDIAKLNLEPSKPAGAPSEVDKVAASAKRAFDAVNSVGTSTPAKIASNPELAKPINERSANLPGEKFAQENNSNDS